MHKDNWCEKVVAGLGPITCIPASQFPPLACSEMLNPESEVIGNGRELDPHHATVPAFIFYHCSFVAHVEFSPTFELWLVEMYGRRNICINSCKQT